MKTFLVTITFEESPDDSLFSEITVRNQLMAADLLSAVDAVRSNIEFQFGKVTINDIRCEEVETFIKPQAE